MGNLVFDADSQILHLECYIVHRCIVPRLSFRKHPPSRFTRWRNQILRTDWGADRVCLSHATRFAGTENSKPKYGPDYPVGSVVYALRGRVMTPERLHEMRLLAEPEPIIAPAIDIHVGRKSYAPSSAGDRHGPTMRSPQAQTDHNSRPFLACNDSVGSRRAS
jgi:hypothetical protein